jgi:SulP family sulfate permease
VIRASRFDAALVAVTAFTAIFIDVEDAILVGVALSILLFTARASRPGMRELIVTPERLIRERGASEERAQSLLIYDIEGELFFGAATQFRRYLTEIVNEADRTGITSVVVRLKRTWNPDVVVLEYLEQFLGDAQARGITVFLAGVRPDLLKIIENVGLTHRFPADQIFPEEDETFSATLRAVRCATQRAVRTRTPVPSDRSRLDVARSDDNDSAPEFYLV